MRSHTIHKTHTYLKGVLSGATQINVKINKTSYEKSSVAGDHQKPGAKQPAVNAPPIFCLKVTALPPLGLVGRMNSFPECSSPKK